MDGFRTTFVCTRLTSGVLGACCGSTLGSVWHDFLVCPLPGLLLPHLGLLLDYFGTTLGLLCPLSGLLLPHPGLLLDYFGITLGLLRPLPGLLLPHPDTFGLLWFTSWFVRV